MIDPSLKATWKILEENALQEGTLTFEAGSVRSVEWLARQIGIDPQTPAWSNQLLEFLTNASLSQEASIRIAATGIARSFRIFGTWGRFVSENPKEQKLCDHARKVSGIFLRSLSHNFLVQFADWLREKLTSILIRRSVLPSEYVESFRRKHALAARPEEGFDAVVSFADAGVRGELEPIDQKVNAKAIAWWESFLQSIERFLHDVFPQSLSPHEDVARLHMLWRMLTREIDMLASIESDLSVQEARQLNNYAWQFRCVRTVLESHRMRHHWNLKDEEIPFIHIKRVLNGQTPSEVARKVLQRLIEADLIRPEDPLVVLQVQA